MTPLFVTLRTTSCSPRCRQRLGRPWSPIGEAAAQARGRQRAPGWARWCRPRRRRPGWCRCAPGDGELQLRRRGQRAVGVLGALGQRHAGEARHEAEAVRAIVAGRRRPPWRSRSQLEAGRCRPCAPRTGSPSRDVRASDDVGLSARRVRVLVEDPNGAFAARTCLVGSLKVGASEPGATIWTRTDVPPVPPPTPPVPPPTPPVAPRRRRFRACRRCRPFRRLHHPRRRFRACRQCRPFRRLHRPRHPCHPDRPLPRPRRRFHRPRRLCHPSRRRRRPFRRRHRPAAAHTARPAADAAVSHPRSPPSRCSRHLRRRCCCHRSRLFPSAQAHCHHTRR